MKPTEEVLNELKKLWVHLSNEERTFVRNCDDVFFYCDRLDNGSRQRLQDILTAHKGEENA